MEVDGTTYNLITDCGSQDGYIYSSQYDQIELCGAACDALAEVGEAQVYYFCDAG